jgi:hypothetical protein
MVVGTIQHFDTVIRLNIVSTRCVVAKAPVALLLPASLACCVTGALCTKQLDSQSQTQTPTLTNTTSPA